MIATQNPIELEGTYPLPEAQLDRFLMRLGVGLPGRGRRGGDPGAPARAARRRGHRPDHRDPRASSWPCRQRSRTSTWRGARALHRGSRPGHAEPITAWRSAPRRAAASPCSSSPGRWRRFRGRDFVLPDDVKAMAVPALAHRLVLKPELWVSRTTPAPGRRGRAPAGARAGRQSPRDRAGDAAEPLLPDRGRLGALPRRRHGPRRALRGRPPAGRGPRGRPALRRPRPTSDRPRGLARPRLSRASA